MQGEKRETGGHPLVEKFLQEFSWLELEELLACFEIKENGFFHLMAIGELYFRFYNENTMLAEIEYLEDEQGIGMIRWAEK